MQVNPQTSQPAHDPSEIDNRLNILLLIGIDSKCDVTGFIELESQLRRFLNPSGSV